jgi:hypothetical protein
MDQLQPGSVFAGHRIEAVVGRGGMGVVYRAVQLDLERVVALKVIGPEMLDDDVMRERFVREAKAGARIDHPNVIPVHYAGEADGIAYIAMRYVDGDDVRSLVRREKHLPAARAARIAAQAGAALDAIHAAGFVHRDVKPANLLLGPDDHVYVSDFGLAKHTLSVGGATKPGHWVGTLDYVAPEQIRGEPIDARCDVYALGGVLFFMLTGEIPYPREGQEAKLWAHLSEAPPRPTALVPDVPGRFDDVLARAMAKDADARYPSAGDLGRAALAAVEGRDVSEPERVVAAGEAAPRGPGSGETGVTVPVDGSTITAARPGSSGEKTTVLPGSGRRTGLIAGIALAGVAAVIAFALLSGGGKEAERPAAKATATATPGPKGPRVAKRIPIGIRGNGVAVAGGYAWVTGFTQTRLLRADVATGKRAPAVAIPEGASDMVASGDSLWIANANVGVIKVDARTGKVAKTLVTRDQPVGVTVAGKDLWVAGLTRTPGQPDSLTRFDRATGEQKALIDLPDGARSVAVGGGAVWVVGRRGNRITKLSPAGQVLKTISVGQDPIDIAYGSGAVWVVTETDNTLVRINPKTGGFASLPAGINPQALEYRANEVWVASGGDYTLRRFSAGKRPKPVGKPLEVDLNPKALTVTDTSVWLTCVGSTSLVRVDY